MSSELAERHRATIVENSIAKPIIPGIELIPVEIEDDESSTPEPLTLRHGSGGRRGLFFILFVIPALATAIYYIFIASDVYVSEAKFIVRTSASGGTLAALTGARGPERSDADSYAVAAFIDSRDAASKMAQNHDMKAIMARPEADFLSRYPASFMMPNEESYYRHYKGMVDVEVDPTTGITTLKVNAFRPEDAQSLANALLNDAEDFVNRLNDQAAKDAEGFARKLVDDAQARVADIETKLANYRNREMVVDPGKEVSASLTSLASLNTEISRMEASLAQQIAMAPDSPVVSPLMEKIGAYRAELNKMQKAIVGSNESLTGKIKDYEMLMLQREMASKELEAAFAQLQGAKHDAQGQRVYLQTLVRPDRPDQPGLPHRWLIVMGVAAFAYAVYRVVAGLVASVMEHEA